MVPTLSAVPDNSAVVESSAVAENSAVVGVSSQPRRAVTKEEIRRAGTQPFKMNNTALKSIRESNEIPFGCPVIAGVDLFPYESYQILSLQRGADEAYWLVPPLQWWSWKKMLNGMTEETLERIVGDGIIGITCQPIPNTSDGKRLRAARKQNVEFPEAAPVPVWDFVVCRGDGSRVRFRPQPDR